MDERLTNGEERIAALLRLAGRRPAVPDDVAQRVRAEVHDEWLRQTRRRSMVRWSAVAAVLATAIATATLTTRTAMTPHPQPVARAVVASVQSVAGGAMSDGGLIEDGAAIRAGEAVETAQSATASMQWGRATLRVAGGTRVRFHSSRRLSLERGTIFVASQHERGLAVQTPLGAVTDVGTEFEVRVAAGRVRVRVREGRVDLREHSAAAGTELEADANGIVARPVSRSGEEWEWVIRAAPPQRLEGRRLREVVADAARERGLSVSWSKVAGDPLLHGSVPLAPDEAMSAALAASGLTSRVDGDRLLIERQR